MLMLVVKRKLFWGGVDVESYIVPFRPHKPAFRKVFKARSERPGPSDLKRISNIELEREKRPKAEIVNVRHRRPKMRSRAYPTPHPLPYEFDR